MSQDGKIANRYNFGIINHYEISQVNAMSNALKNKVISYFINKLDIK